ncbi:MAG: CPBP family intramembrane metalloprotease [Verrucomicrobiota bacterium]|nr:CPBP family intramembrane metalloprotease [Verrucomicrobiota bacterium]
MRDGRHPGRDPLRSIASWSAMLLASPLIGIICRTSGHAVPDWWPATQSAIVAAFGVALLLSERLRPAARFVFALVALRIGWNLVAPWFAAIPAVQSWTEGHDWCVRLFVSRFATLAGALLMCIPLVGSGVGRRELFLRLGELNAPAAPMPYLGVRRSIRWTIFGPALLVVFGIALPLFLFFTLKPNFRASAQLLQFLPCILASAALNAISEEFQFRCVPLALLRDVMSPAGAMLVTAVFFGLGHFYGQPSGPIGVLMAGFAGWIWAKSMIETRGIFWAFAIHMIQDIVIFSFLCLSAAK